MKKLVLLVAMATTLMSCNRYVNVKLTNGAIVKCLNESRIDFPEYTMEELVTKLGYEFKIKKQ